ncbi:MAG: DNA polymerase subunit beta [Spirochaetaceae bacterium]|nr:MAG: DNA polymerase subunit beta [Spirochaetaceae bacterium]
MEFPKYKFDDAVLLAIVKKYKMRELAFFGSVLRSDFNAGSDIDILVEFDADAHYSLFDLFKIREDLSAIFGRNVDLVEKAGIKNPYRRQEIVENAMVLYAS